jgi:hypothetical protein
MLTYFWTTVYNEIIGELACEYSIISIAEGIFEPISNSLAVHHSEAHVQ